MTPVQLSSPAVRPPAAQAPNPGLAPAVAPEAAPTDRFEPSPLPSEGDLNQQLQRLNGALLARPRPGMSPSERAALEARRAEARVQEQRILGQLGTHYDRQRAEGGGRAVPGWVHGTLDVAGMVPGLGEPADLLNAGLYALQGDSLNAGISLAAAAVPVGGQALTGARLAARAAQQAPRVGSRISAHPGLVREAEQATRNPAVQREVNQLVEQFRNGNLNPGLGNRSLNFGGVHEMRGRNGGRVYFRNVEGGIEILGKSDKSNQGRVISILRGLYGG